jgi:hypothetical protein
LMIVESAFVYLYFKRHIIQQNTDKVVYIEFQF